MCKGTGLYSGWAEPKGTAVICSYCNGKGWYTYFYKVFSKRKKLKGIKSVRISKTGVNGSASKLITYAEFEKKIPDNYAEIAKLLEKSSEELYASLAPKPVSKRKSK